MNFFSPPNQLTFLRILLTPVFLVLLLSSHSVLRQWSLAVFIFAAITDWYDGWLARRWGYVTRWGAFFDPLADKILTSAALLAYASLGLVSGWMVWIIVIRDIIITVLRSYAEYKGKPVDTSKLAKTKTFAQYVLIYYLLLFYVAQNTPSIEERFSGLIQALLNYSFIYIAMLLITGITLWTGIIYIFDNWKTIRELYESSNTFAKSE
ncbi:MAG: CDP-diacylglycerol--glycerol-3-phosphate 3-phosphatidyltransferase [Ignavibacteriae bacterium]|nr:MAG: CDP-diacylglycerol--glycerol-3-phosphate 3-phosphatidyltransferase [Ignavibacteriota bacterium]